MLLDPPLTGPRITAFFTLLISVGLVLFASSRQHSGLPGPMSEAMLSDLRARLQSQGTIPELPGPWRSQSTLLAASGTGFGGDFLVANPNEHGTRLELILVDVVGKGVGAASRARQFGGALGGLISALPPQGLFAAANDFLLRQECDETFAWRTDQAAGTALGIVPLPEMTTTSGVLAPGEALMFYTDGVVESRDTDLDEGVAWLQREATEAIAPGFCGGAERILSRVKGGDDDRAVLIVERTPEPATAGNLR